jgi:hypothetical protein
MLLWAIAMILPIRDERRTAMTGALANVRAVVADMSSRGTLVTLVPHAVDQSGKA